MPKKLKLPPTRRKSFEKKELRDKLLNLARDRNMRQQAAFSGVADDIMSVIQSQRAGGDGGVPRTISEQEALDSFYRYQYSAMTGIAEAFTMIDWHVEERKAKQWTRLEDGEHELELLLQNPNPIMTGAELMYTTIVEIYMVGKAHWSIVRDGLGMPVEIWPLWGTVTASVEKSDLKVITGWKHVFDLPDGGEGVENFAPEDVIMHRLPKPKTLFEGYGVAQAMGSSIKMDQKMLESMWKVFSNGMWPMAILKIPTDDPDERKEIWQEFADEYAGTQNSGAPIGISSSMDVVFGQQKVGELGWSEGEMRVRDSILGGFRYPKALLGLSDDYNKANIDGVEYIFGKWTILPKLFMFTQRINQRFVIPNWGEDTRLTYTSPVAEDAEQKELFVLDRVKNGLMTPWQAMAELGIDPEFDTPELHRYYMPLGQEAYASAKGDEIIDPDAPKEDPEEPEDEDGEGEEEPEEKEKPETPEDPEDEENPEDSEDGEDEEETEQSIDKHRTEGFVTQQRRNSRILGRAAKVKKRIQIPINAAVTAFYADVGKDVLKAWQKYKNRLPKAPSSGAQSLQDITDLNSVEFDQHLLDLISQALPPELEKALKSGILTQELVDMLEDLNRRGLFLGGQFEDSLHPENTKPWDRRNKAIDEYMKEFQAANYAGIIDTTRLKFADAVAQGLIVGDSWDQINDRLIHAIDVLTTSHALTIADTESTKLLGAGGQAFRDDNDITNKQWITSFVNSRETHIKADGQTVPNKKEFKVGKDRMQWPGSGSTASENVNCHCVAVGIFSGKKKK